MIHKSRTAVAIPSNGEGTLFSVQYVGSKDNDSGVNYDYLKALAKKGYTVRVNACAATAEHTIHADFHARVRLDLEEIGARVFQRASDQRWCACQFDQNDQQDHMARFEPQDTKEKALEKAARYYMV